MPELLLHTSGLCIFVIRIINAVARWKIIKFKLLVISSFCIRYFLSIRTLKLSRRCLHFEVVGGLELSNDPESYAGGSVATGRVSLAGKVKGDDPD